MNLLVFISSLSCGGAERVTANLANYWVNKGWQVTVVTLSNGGDDFYTLSPAVQRIALGLIQKSPNPLLGLFNNLRRILALRQVLRQTKPDIALAMMDRANVLLALAAWRLPGLVTIGSERTYPPRSQLGWCWEQLRYYCYGLLGALVALTSEGGEWLQRYTLARKVAVIPNAVPWPLPNQPSMRMPSEILIPGRKVLLGVGRLVEEKGFDLLIDSFAMIAAQHPEWDLVIVGEGPQRSILQEQIAQFGLGGRIHLVGQVDNIGDWYKAADLYVLSSRFEGFPNALAEALAYGLPAVSFDCETGPHDIIRHGVDGLLVPPGDRAALAEALHRLMDDEDLRRRFGSRAAESRERFSLQRIAGMWEALFDEVTR